MSFALKGGGKFFMHKSLNGGYLNLVTYPFILVSWAKKILSPPPSLNAQKSMSPSFNQFLTFVII